MSFDIHGNKLQQGHCEVHPQVAEEYPCSVCNNEHYRKVASSEQQGKWKVEDELAIANARILQLETNQSNCKIELKKQGIKDFIYQVQESGNLGNGDTQWLSDYAEEIIEDMEQASEVPK